MFKANLTNCDISFGNAFPATEITPSPPTAIKGSVKPSSPEITVKLRGLFLITCIIWSIEPQASFIAVMFSKSFANLTTVSGRIFTPVLPGTLYKINCVGQTLAIVAKC
ncbi:MAG: hypothetical protein BWX59_01878 [Bacteroidetes bacterium ADurb.Bin028]|nr:MAG: hypothetical protein BWX59_01878 [Bacteroidetes bacterium ADurb.Bin028]